MILDVHVAFLVTSLSVLFGLTYSIGRFLDHKINQIRKERQAHNLSGSMTENISGSEQEAIAA